MENKKIVHPYMPNSEPNVKKSMMDYLGIDSIEELYTYIPDELRFKGKLGFPEAFLSEYELKEHVESILTKNKSSKEFVSFLGGGCYNHYVPAICDEISQRSEFLTAYCGGTYTDHGKTQAIFEFTSLMGELLDMDVVGLPTYDGSQAAGTSIRMANRITGRKEVLVPSTMSPEVLSHVKNYCDFMDINYIDFDKDLGILDLDDLKSKISDKTAAVYIENPSFLGTIETQGKLISEVAHNNGAIFIVYAEPSSLGVLEAPSNYGADIICGDIQCLGMHMMYGSGHAGFISTHNKSEYIMNYPTHFYGLYENSKGEFGFSRSLNQRTSYGSRENAVEYLGTNSGLWAITAAVYLSLMGPEGMYELGIDILSKSKYLGNEVNKLGSVNLKFKDGVNFSEVVIDFSKSGKSVDQINKALLEKGIFGGLNLSNISKELENCLLVCVTEKTKKEHIDMLIKELSNII